jgi:glycosyltransferase involved in cell wall biosynthesis
MPARLALCLEQTLGHRSHAQNLSEAVVSSDDASTILAVDYSPPGRLPVPWALRASRMARSAVRNLASKSPVDVVFYHTQCVSLFAPWTMDRPYVVSIDATPVQLDTMGKWYAHRRGPRAAEQVKAAWYRKVFGGASALVSWSSWAAESLVTDYAADAAKIHVVHPGAPTYLFDIPRVQPGRKPRILFVGGDFERKGGMHLLEAFGPLRDSAELVLVTEDPVDPMPGIEVLHGIRPGTPGFIKAFSDADLFCLPTLGDCTPVAIGEALAAGLPVLTTRIGSNAETVRHGETGLLVAPGSTEELRRALNQLISDPALLASMGTRAREDARGRFDAAANARRVLYIACGAAS